MEATSARSWAVRNLHALTGLVCARPDATSGRLVSVDAARAAAVLGMLLVNNRSSAGTPPIWTSHAPGEGIYFADLVFPAFLFMVGVSMALSFSRRSEQPPLRVWGHFAARVLLLVVIGIVLNYYRYGEPVRIPGVLQRIALASALAAPFARKDSFRVLAAAALMLLVHTALLLKAGGPGVVPGSFGDVDTIARLVDVRAFGVEHIYRSRFDPEGLLGVISSAGHVLLGVVLGRALVRPADWKRLCAATALAGAAVLAGLGMSPYVPIVKDLWTASFVLVTSGGTALVVIALYLLGDVLRGARVLAWATPPGRNAIALYVGSLSLDLWLRTQHVGPDTGSAHATLSAGFVGAFGDVWGALGYSLAHVVLWFAVAAVLDRSRIYIKL